MAFRQFFYEYQSCLTLMLFYSILQGVPQNLLLPNQSLNKTDLIDTPKLPPRFGWLHDKMLNQRFGFVIFFNGSGSVICLTDPDPWPNEITVPDPKDCWIMWKKGTILLKQENLYSWNFCHSERLWVGSPTWTPWWRAASTSPPSTAQVSPGSSWYLRTSPIRWLA